MENIQSLADILAALRWLAGPGAAIVAALLYDLLADRAPDGAADFLTRLRPTALPIVASLVAAVAGRVALALEPVAASQIAPVIDAAIPTVISLLLGWVASTRYLAVRHGG